MTAREVSEANTGDLAYPGTRRGSWKRSLGGMEFDDPYQWLEEDTPEVAIWQERQAEIAAAYVEDWPYFDRLQTLVEDFSTERRVSLPRFAGGKWFCLKALAGSPVASVFVSATPQDPGRLLFDPLRHDPHCPAFVSWISPSPDGEILALGLCRDGSEKNHVFLIDVPSGQLRADAPTQRLMDNWTGGAHWLPDSGGFFFSALTADAKEFDQDVYLHRLLPVPVTQQQPIAWTRDRSYRMVTVARNGRYALAYERLDNPIPVAVADLADRAWKWRPFITSYNGIVAGPVVGDRLIAVTDHGADRGRLVGIDLTDSRSADPERWTELVPESMAVMRGVQHVAGRLYVTEFVDSYARIRIFDEGGGEVGAVPVPGKGAVSELPFPIMSLIPFGHPDIFLFGFSTFLASWSILAHHPAKPGIETIGAADIALDDVTVEDCWATSGDGTRIAYHIVRRDDLGPGPRPALVYAYGAFNMPLLPQFPGPAAAIVKAGGLFVHAHLRGGGEFGKAWWEGGRLRNKQTGYDDLYAVAEDLIARGRTASTMLAVTGASNGGLMAAVAAVQRPDLWSVAIPRVPLLDLIGACWNDYDRMCIQNEYADLSDPDEIRRLVTFSPCHRVAADICYPAVYLDAGETDPRCPAWHSRKFAAQLQAGVAANPVLLRVWKGVGHGWATGRQTAVRQASGWLAFLLRRLGLGDQL